MSAEHIEQAPGFEVPKGPPEQAPSGERVQEGIERGAPAKEGGGRAPAQAMPPLPTPTAPPPPPPTATEAPTADQPAAVVPDAPSADLSANDADLIEKEWVDRAKNIVADTREDPHQQKNQISQVKADYVAKRFNKSLKVDDVPSA